ncbi:MAG: hypothetical protein AB203_00880 [Parcubacteria bacterium C7867-008]|nr:MAG: hypothetical protein AB203_00880 [Parcubacteria bacterium C7867-008]
MQLVIHEISLWIFIGGLVLTVLIWLLGFFLLMRAGRYYFDEEAVAEVFFRHSEQSRAVHARTDRAFSAAGIARYAWRVCAGITVLSLIVTFVSM